MNSPANTVAIIRHTTRKPIYVIAHIVHLHGRAYAMPFPDGSGYAWSELQFRSKAKARAAAAVIGNVLQDVFVQDFTARRCYAIKSDTA